MGKKGTPHRKWSAEEKVRIVTRHLEEHVSLRQLEEEEGAGHALIGSWVKRVFLFGTAGFGGAAEYFDRILAGVMALLDPMVTVVGTYMCQGKMPMAVRKRYEALQSTDPERARGMLENFDKALSHPDESDLAGLENMVHNVL